MQPPVISSKPIYTEVKLQANLLYISIFCVKWCNNCCYTFYQAKPLPPSRPLPPLATKPVSCITESAVFTHLHPHISPRGSIRYSLLLLLHLTVLALPLFWNVKFVSSKMMKPKPLRPTVKPKFSAVSSPLPHTQLVRIQTTVQSQPDFPKCLELKQSWCYSRHSGL